MKTIMILKQRICLLTASILATSAPAAIFTNLYNFSGSVFGTNSDGAQPSAALTLSVNTLYGTTAGGGLGEGTVFRINTDGTGFIPLHAFREFSGASTNSDGTAKFTVLALSGNELFGAGPAGGSAGEGALFRLNTDGTGFTNLHNFTASPSNLDGANPETGVALSGGRLFGTTTGGGAGGQGTIFTLDTDGSGFTNFYSFAPFSTGEERVNPETILLVSGSALYGTTMLGGDWGYGVLFRVNFDGTGFTNLYSFETFDESGPHGSLVLSGGVLYGITLYTVFKVNLDGTGFTNLYRFTPLVLGINGYGNLVATNTDGYHPTSGLVLLGNTLYGTTQDGGAAGGGTVFKVNTDGSGFATLYNFSAPVTGLNATTNTDGYSPQGGLVLSGGTLFGTTSSCGFFGSGTIFALTIIPTLELHLNGLNAVLSWNDPVFQLQAGPTATGQFTNVIGAASPYTNTVTGSQQFFRLVAY